MDRLLNVPSWSHSWILWSKPVKEPIIRRKNRPFNLLNNIVGKRREKMAFMRLRSTWRSIFLNVFVAKGWFRTNTPTDISNHQMKHAIRVVWNKVLRRQWRNKSGQNYLCWITNGCKTIKSYKHSQVINIWFLSIVQVKSLYICFFTLRNNWKLSWLSSLQRFLKQ